MTQRSKHLSVYALLIGLLILSFATNILFYNRILILQDFITGSNPWISKEEFISIEKEINRLSENKYTIDNQDYIQFDVKTKQPIVNNLMEQFNTNDN